MAAVAVERRVVADRRCGMAASVPATDRRAPVQTLDRQLTLGPLGLPSRQTTVNSAPPDWILPLVARAIDQSMSRKEAALTMQIDQAQMTRQLAADGHLSIRKLGVLGESFWLNLADGIRAHFGLDDDEQRLDRALDGLSASVQVIAQIARKRRR